MRTRKARQADAIGQSENVQDAGSAPKMTQSGLGRKRGLRSQLESNAALLTANLNRKLDRGSLAEKENASSAPVVVKNVACKTLESDNPNVRRALRSCTLRNNKQDNDVTIAGKASNCFDERVKNASHRETGRFKRKVEDSLAVSVSPTIFHDENSTFVNSIKTFSKNMPFCSTPMISSDDEAKKDACRSSFRLKNKRLDSSISLIPSAVTIGDTAILSNPFKVPVSKHTKLKDVPFSSTPMKDLRKSNNDLHTDKVPNELLPKLVLSPIRDIVGCNTRSKTNSKKPSNLSKESAIDGQLASDNDACPYTASQKITNKFIVERNALFKSKPTTNSKLLAKRKGQMQDKVIEPPKDAGTPETGSQFFNSDSSSTNSSSEEYDPYKLFILYDPVMTNDLPDPRTSKFRICEMKIQDFDDLGLPVKPKKPTGTKPNKKPAAKCEKVNCGNKDDELLQRKIEELNREFSEIESMELCVE